MGKFEKGQSGNPRGRPRSEQAITPWLRKLLEEKRAGKTRAEHVANAWIKAAEAGDVNAIKALADRVDGKVPDSVDVTSGGKSFSFTLDLSGKGVDADRDG